MIFLLYVCTIQGIVHTVCFAWTSHVTHVDACECKQSVSHLVYHLVYHM